MGKKKKNHKQFIRFDNIEKVKLTSIPLGKGVIDYLDSLNPKGSKSVHALFKEDLGAQDYEKYRKIFGIQVHDSIPKEVIDKCEYCDIVGDEFNKDRVCNAYNIEAGSNELFALSGFYEVINQNIHLFEDQAQRKRLCMAFIGCFRFHKGRVYFDNNRLLYQCFKEGLRSISTILENSDSLNRLALINNSMHKLDNEQRFYTIDNGVKNDILEIQLDHFKEAERYYKNQSENKESKTTRTNKRLSQIWLAEPKLSIDDFLQKGIDVGIWNENFDIIVKRGSLYGTGKTLLSNLAHAVRGYCISHQTDYKIIGKAFCEQFKIEISESTNEPYKVFNKENRAIKDQLKRAFSIR